MRLDSCRQCVRRRIRCDAGTPECAKCLKKNIKCSGVGKQYRFVDGVASRRTTKASLVVKESRVLRASEHATADRQETAAAEFLTEDKSQDLHQIYHGSLADDGEQFLGSESDKISLFSTADSIDTVCPDNALALATNGQLYGLESLRPTSRMLFDHFSNIVAPAMVVIDHHSNGYRNILLPLATQDPLVQRAVSVVAALHLGRKQIDLLQAAEKGRSVIIERLRKDASQGQRDKIFNMSTWATLILLLVGETVTGGQDFIHIFAMLRSFLENSDELLKIPPQAGRFLLQQSQMFSLFTPPFLGPVHGSSALQQRIDNFLDWIEDPTSEYSSLSSILLLKKSIYVARDLYLRETESKLSAADRQDLVEYLLQLLAPVNEATPGMHAFVWCYFIAGASSSDSQSREFVSERLRQVYKRTGMRNILSAIDILEQFIWPLPDGQNWTHCPDVLNRTLIM